MEKYIPYERLSKKEKRKLDSTKRGTWGERSPVTRKPQNSKAYNRSTARNWKREHHETNSGTFHFIRPCFSESSFPDPARSHARIGSSNSPSSP